MPLWRVRIGWVISRALEQSKDVNAWLWTGRRVSSEVEEGPPNLSLPVLPMAPPKVTN